MTDQAREIVRARTVHQLKTWPGPFKAIKAGLKLFEVRKDDRDYRLGDVLELREYDPVSDSYSGDVVSRPVTYIMGGGQFGLHPDYIVMGISAESSSPAMVGEITDEMIQTFCYAGYGTDTDRGSNLWKVCDRGLRAVLALFSPPQGAPDSSEDSVRSKEREECARLRKGIQMFLDGDAPPRIGKADKCQHGRYGYEACESCISAWFTMLLGASAPHKTGE